MVQEPMLPPRYISYLTLYLYEAGNNYSTNRLHEEISHVTFQFGFRPSFGSFPDG